MAPQVGVKYAIPRPLGGALCSLETLAAASGTLDCVPIGRPDIGRWVAGIRGLDFRGLPPAVDMQGRTHPISGYRIVHWSPDLKPGPSNHMDLSSWDSVLTVAAVLSYFTARSVCLDNESSELLLLTPHNDTVYDLQDALGLPASNYPPTLYDFYLTILYKQHFERTMMPISFFF